MQLMICKGRMKNVEWLNAIYLGKTLFHKHALKLTKSSRGKTYRDTLPLKFRKLNSALSLIVCCL